MVRLLVLHNKPEDVDAFERHYREVHIPLAKKLPGLRNCQFGRNAVAIHGVEPYYLIAQLEWDDMAGLQTAFQPAEGRATAEDVTFLEKLSPGVRSMIYEVEEV